MLLEIKKNKDEGVYTNSYIDTYLLFRCDTYSTCIKACGGCDMRSTTNKN